jgi:Domain of unknown function (DUF4124)
MTYNKKGGKFQAWFGIYFLSIFLFVASHPSNSSAAIYRWVDSSGMVHVSDGLDNVPPTYRNNLKIVTEPYEVGRGIIIPFKRTASGLVLVDAVLNGNVKAELILDTGANLVVITEALSKKLNQDLSLHFIPLFNSGSIHCATLHIFGNTFLKEAFGKKQYGHSSGGSSQ